MAQTDRRVPGQELVERLLGSFHWSEFRRVARVAAIADSEERVTLELTLQTEFRPRNVEIVLVAVNATCIRLDHFIGSGCGLGGFEIFDKRDDQWERVKWALHDYEADSVSCYAEDLRVVRAEYVRPA
jgi:hypothetical protein